MQKLVSKDKSLTDDYRDSVSFKICRFFYIYVYKGFMTWPVKPLCTLYLFFLNNNLFPGSLYSHSIVTKSLIYFMTVMFVQCQDGVNLTESMHKIKWVIMPLFYSFRKKNICVTSISSYQLVSFDLGSKHDSRSIRIKEIMF